MSHRLLLVHGDDWVSQRLQDMLADTALSVTRVRDGVAGLTAVAQARPDAVLTDLVLPRLDGITLLRALQGRPDTRDLPALILSARWSPQEAMRGLAAGARYVVAVPFQEADLLSKLRRLVTGPASARETGR